MAKPPLIAMPGPEGAASHCPRCEQAFHCGANDAKPCPCTTIALSPATLIALRERWQGCLCLTCLAQIQRGEEVVP